MVKTFFEWTKNRLMEPSPCIVLVVVGSSLCVPDFSLGVTIATLSGYLGFILKEKGYI